MMATENRLAVTRGWGLGELALHGHRASVWEDEEVPETDGGDGGTTK